ncbi:MAG: D-alanyl-D-alanine carboxypeptidase family protein [Pseudomonadota bacterium]|nr:D-alanyl-D-alanine carboxypeptidase family protein [Pseudomonadota bacterium]
MTTRLRILTTVLVAGLSTHVSAVTIMPSPPQLDNKAYILVDYESGQVLAASNPDERLPPASLTKMMTSLIVEQKLMAGQLKEDEPIRMSESAWCRGSSSESCMYVPLNGTATALEMLRGIIVQSGNDASKAIAEHLAGNEGGFADMMNAEAKRLGMTNTNFLNATGLHMENHYSSARDMATLARTIIRDSADYYPIYSEKEFTFNNIRQGNRNALLYTDPSVDGLKTGYTSAAGYCLTTSSKRGSMRLISVIMGAPSVQGRAEQSRELLNWGFSNFETVNVRPAGQALATTPLWFGQDKTVTVGLSEHLTVTLPRGKAESIQTQFSVQPNLKAPIQQGQVVGKLIATLDGQAIAERPLVALQAVEQAGFFSRLLDRIQMLIAKLLNKSA